MAKDGEMRIDLRDPHDDGGVLGYRGYAFQNAYVVSCLPAWLHDPHFCEFTFEGAEDVDVLFRRDDHDERWAIQVKSSHVALNEARKVFALFLERELESPDTFQRFILACPTTSNSLRRLQAAVEEVRRLTRLHGPEHPLLATARARIERNVDKLSLPVDAQFLEARVYFETDLVGLDPGPESKLYDLFAGAMLRLHGWWAKKHTADAVCDRLQALMHHSLRVTRSRKEVEDIVYMPGTQRLAWIQTLDGQELRLPFKRHTRFVGREDLLDRLYKMLSPVTPEGKRVAALTGMGGIGKTQMAVEFAYRHHADYADGIFWINAARPIGDELAKVGRSLLRGNNNLHMAGTSEPSPDDLIRLANIYLQQHANALLILDNLSDPALFHRPMDSGIVLSELQCRVLITTQVRSLGDVHAIDVGVLDEEQALVLLLRGPDREPLLDPTHPEHQAAKRVCEALGWLPLAIEIAGSFLRSWPKESLADFETRLRTEGGLETVDYEGPELGSIDGPTAHDPSVKVTLDLQYTRLDDEVAKRLLWIAGQLPKAVTIPAARLGLLANVADDRRPGRPSRLQRALRHLYNASLVEELRGDRVRLHPLIHDFAAGLLPADKARRLCRDCVAGLVGALENVAELEEQCTQRGVDSLQEDLLVALSLLSATGDDDGSLDRRLQALLRLLARECDILRAWDRQIHPTALAQQIHYRAVDLQLSTLATFAAARLNNLNRPWLALQWRAGHPMLAVERIVAAHAKAVRALAVLPDGRYVMSGGEDGSVKLWDLATGRATNTLMSNGRPVTAIAAAANGSRAVAADGHGHLWEWERPNGRDASLKGHRVAPAGTAIWAVSIAADGSRAVCGSSDGQVTLWALGQDPDVDKPEHVFPGHTRRVLAVAELDGGRCIASGALDGTLQVCFRNPAGEWVPQTVARGRSAVRTIAALPEDLAFLVGNDEGTIEIWDVSIVGTPRCVDTLSGHGGPVTALAVIPGGQQIISGSSDGSLYVWTPAAAGDPERKHRKTGLASGGSGIYSVVVSPDGLRAITGHSDGMLRVWVLSASVADLEPRISEGHRDWVWCVTGVGSSGQVAASGGGEGVVKLWRLADVEGRYVTASLHISGAISALAATPDGSRLVIGLDNGTVEVWDVSTFGCEQRVGSFQAHTSTVTSLTMVGEDQALSAGNDGTVQIWDLSLPAQDKRAGRRITSTRTGISTIAALPDGKWALTGGDDGSVVAWSLAPTEDASASTAREVVVGRHGARVRAVAVTADGRHAASGGDDGTIRVWEISTLPASLGLQRVLAGHEGPVLALCHEPLSGGMISGGDDATLRLWTLLNAGRRSSAAIGWEVCIRLEAPVWAVAAIGNGVVIAGDAVGNVYCFQAHDARRSREGQATGRRERPRWS
ncbi:MAG: hypothetical protein JXA14_22750 [Anaerolineae bacterium]|nr:hypothetical protein [Anaerolineae bacterium]